jgi:hypothetical protein
MSTRAERAAFFDHLASERMSDVALLQGEIVERRRVGRGVARLERRMERLRMDAIAFRQTAAEWEKAS